MDCSPPGSSVHGIFQARVLEWGAIAFSGLLSRGGQSLVVVHRLLTALASLVANTGSRACGFGSCVSQALEDRLSSCGAQA